MKKKKDMNDTERFITEQINGAILGLSLIFELLLCFLLPPIGIAVVVATIFIVLKYRQWYNSD